MTRQTRAASGADGRAGEQTKAYGHYRACGGAYPYRCGVAVEAEAHAGKGAEILCHCPAS